MEKALDNIFRDVPTGSRSVIIVRKEGRTRYHTEDVFGRVFAADSDVIYKVGSFVTILAGRIVGTSPPFSTPVNYTV